MLRSQSISNLSDRKPKTGGFLHSLKSRKSFSKDLKSQLRPSLSDSKPLRPLTSSVSSMNLLHKRKEDTPNYSQSVARERNGSHDNKENYLLPLMTLKSKPTATSSAPSFDESRSLKSRSSAPNLKASPTTTSNKVNHRNSTCYTYGHATKASISSSIVTSTSSLFNIMSDEENTTVSSPLTPVDDFMDAKQDTVLDDTITFDYDGLSDEDFNFDDDAASMLQTDHATKKMHRTTNILNISEFIKSIDHSQEIIPMNNRKSLEFEQDERNQIKQTLQQNCKHSSVDLHLIENVMFIAVDLVQEKVVDRSKSKINSISDWLDQDYSQVLKDDPYYDDDYYLTL